MPSRISTPTVLDRPIVSPRGSFSTPRTAESSAKLRPYTGLSGGVCAPPIHIGIVPIEDCPGWLLVGIGLATAAYDRIPQCTAKGINMISLVNSLLKKDIGLIEVTK